MNSKDIQDLVLLWIKRLLFPDFANRLTMIVVLAGVGLVALPHELWVALANWGIGVGNNLGLTLAPIPQLPYEPNPLGLWLIIIGLAYHLASRLVAHWGDVIHHDKARGKRQADVELYDKFLELLPSDGSALVMLRDHDFANTFMLARLDPLRKFADVWNDAEYQFLDEFVETAKTTLVELAEEFLLKIATYTAPSRNGHQTVYPTHVDPEGFIPEHVRNEIKELNLSATALYREHQLFIRLCRDRL